MRSCRFEVAFVVLVLVASDTYARDPLVSYLPAADLPNFIVTEFDLRSISSSLNPRRTTQQSRLTEVGLRITDKSATRIVLDGADDIVVIEVLRRGDANNDGIEDVVICFSEKAKSGTLASSAPYLLQKYSKDAPLIALANNVYDKKCVEQ